MKIEIVVFLCIFLHLASAEVPENLPVFSNSQAHIKEEYAPKIKILKPYEGYALYQNVTLECLVEAYPPPGSVKLSNFLKFKKQV